MYMYRFEYMFKSISLCKIRPLEKAPYNDNK